MLIKIREYIKQKKMVSNQQIAREFKLELQALQPMLDLWLFKGAIKDLKKPVGCKKPCFNCKIPTLIYYQIV